jgi:hypothetical protein
MLEELKQGLIKKEKEIEELKLNQIVKEKTDEEKAEFKKRNDEASAKLRKEIEAEVQKQNETQ